MSEARRRRPGIAILAAALVAVATPAAGAEPPVKVLLMVLQRPRAVTLAAPERALARVWSESASGSMALGPDPVEARVAEGGRELVLSGGLPAPRRCRELTVGPALLRMAQRGAAGREYRGRLTVAVRGGALRLTLELPPGQFAAGVAGTELAPGSPPEAARAQAVACLSYILANRGRHRLQGADFCDTTHCQHYLGEDPGAARSGGQALAGAGSPGGRLAEPTEVLLWNGQPLPAYFTADCGGELAGPSELWGGEPGPYRVGPDSWCTRAAGGVPGALWRAEFPAELFAKAIAAAAGRPWPERQSADSIGVEYSGGAGSSIVSYFYLGEGRGRLRAGFERVNRTLRGMLGRWALHGRRLSMTVRGGVVRLEGRGRGHLAGLCQRGAAQMARAGKSCREILAFYYPGARLAPRASVLR